MSYRSLLFCPDEKTARVVSQVLTELEFAVEPLTEVFPAAKRLGEERFDAVVVDCQNEQEAAVLFKAARESTQNHSSLSVAIVEGQAGVAKAFRIGANLVLSKPINVEQSKGTLRVARGLLRKNDVKPAAPARVPGKSIEETVSFPIASGTTPTPAKLSETRSVVIASTTANAPFSSLEVEAEPTPEPEAAEAAVLESLPELTGNSLAHTPSPTAHIGGEPIAGAPGSAGAAVARALEKPEIVERKPQSLPPMVTNEPIVSKVSIPERVQRETSDVPVFSSFESAGQAGGGTKFLKVAAVVLVTVGAAFFGWTRLQPLKYLQRAQTSRTAAEVAAPPPAPAPLPPTPNPSLAAPTQVAQQPPAGNQQDLEISAAPAHTGNEDDDADDIRVQELPMSRDSKPTAPKAEPLVVKSDIAVMKPKPVQATPPPLQISAANGSALPLNNLPESTPELPKLAPASLRVSQGVSQGLILKKVPPQYPQMALQLHKQGAVELLVTITKQGTISSIRVVSGDTLLAKAAVDAVHQWKYRPYLLNGEPVEIQTQITINFTAPH